MIKDFRLQVRMEASLAKKIQARATAEGLNASTWLRTIAIKALKSPVTDSGGKETSSGS